MFKRLPLAICILFLSLPFVGAASDRVNGQFTATDACSAYQSFKNKTNPGNITISTGEVYKVIEKNDRSIPKSVRIIVSDATPKKRWVASNCGKLNIMTTVGHRDNIQEGSCNTKNLADSYVLALSWQPAFCEIKPDKAECKVTDASSYQANNFTLHGLWPNRNTCGIGYGWCDKKITKQKKFCNYQKLELTDETRNSLEKYMPSAKHGTCLQRHEWYKHGSCQNLSPSSYYDLSIKLLKGINSSKFGGFTRKNVGKKVSVKALKQAFDDSYGPGAHNALTIKCNNGDLVDLYRNLKVPEASQDSIDKLLIYSDTEFTDIQCGSVVTFDLIND